MEKHDAKDTAKCGRVLFIVDGNIKGKYTGLKEITDEKERERSLNNWLLDLGWQSGKAFETIGDDKFMFQAIAHA